MQSSTTLVSEAHEDILRAESTSNLAEPDLRSKALEPNPCSRYEGNVQQEFRDLQSMLLRVDSAVPDHRPPDFARRMYRLFKFENDSVHKADQVDVPKLTTYNRHVIVRV